MSILLLKSPSAARFTWPEVSLVAVLVATLLLGPWSAVRGADYEATRDLFLGGQYAECLESIDNAIQEGVYQQQWRLLKIETELTVGRYPEALNSLETALRRHPTSLELHLIGETVYQVNGQPEKAESLGRSIERLARQSPWRYNDRESRVTLGQYFLRRGADARQVLEVFYDPVRKQNPDYVPIHLASGQLALQKDDYALAAEFFRAALKLDPADPEIHYLLARSLSSGDAAAAAKALGEALQRNPRHVDSLLLQADHLIDSENYDGARDTLEQILQVNPEHPRAWAYLAVLAHLQNDADAEQLHRRVALGWWATNPEVDHLIGRKLSQKYRFAEGAEYQRQALKLDAGYLPAKIQLCQDLLRLGREGEGWALANEVFERDGYNVLAHNLLNLHDNLSKFRTLEDDDPAGGKLIVRMASNEAEIYGQRVMQLLRQARSTLCQKYDVQLTEPVIVEIFPQQSDFAIRTFGMPGGQGFLGVCFGNVITANSPASQGNSPANWESVLWHEFCHVVTLHKTNNKMPRWLSEGISVYEERQANPAWGEAMTLRYREMVLSDDELTPVSELSGAFLNPASPIHLQFAYYESSLVVEYLIDRYGLEMLQRVLVDLSVGMPVNESLARYTGSIDGLNQEFAKFAKQQANQLGNDVDWSEQEIPSAEDPEALQQWAQQHPKHFPGQLRYARHLVEQQQWEQALPVLQNLIQLHPGFTESDNAYVLLAMVHQQMGQVELERQVLTKLTQLDDDAVDIGLRLLELDAAATDWEAVRNTAERILAVNPLIVAPHRHLAEAATRLGDHQKAAQAYRAVLALEPRDLAQMHHRLARSLIEIGQWQEARRQVLMALEEAPRYRDAHRTLLEIVQRTEDATSVDSVAPQVESEHAPSERTESP